MGTRVGVVWIGWLIWMYMGGVQGEQHDKNMIVNLCTQIEHCAYIVFHGTELNWECLQTVKIEVRTNEKKKII
jgi:hypothetical protein